MKTFAWSAVLLLLAAGAARAEDACKPDVEKLCAGIPPGGGRILACLKANESKVSAACKKEIATVAAALKEIGNACEADVMRFCSNVPRGQGRVAKCLAANGASLEPQCKEIVDAVREKASDFKKACGGDASKFCKGIPPGQGRILACLASKEAELSPSCKKAMSK